MGVIFRNCCASMNMQKQTLCCYLFYIEDIEIPSFDLLEEQDRNVTLMVIH